MKFLTLALSLIFTAGLAFAAPSTPYKAPFKTDVASQLKSHQTAITALQALPSNKAPGVDGIGNIRFARVTYDVAVNGGTIGAHALAVGLPAKAIVIRSWFYINTQFVDAGSGTVALSCEDANNLKTATDITGSAVGALVEGQSTGAASAFVSSIAADCTITATVAGADQTAGSLTLWVMYVVSN